MVQVPAIWWQRGVVYQIYPRSFQDTDQNGIGDLAGVLARLDYLQQTLAVDAMWLSPFYPSPMTDFGYDVADYCDVDRRFGTLEDFDRLVAAAHARDLKVIIDYVPNHTSDQHPWFLESRSSRDNPYRDWYVWRDPAPSGGPPNNWLASFGGAAWSFDEQTGQYYLHSFLREQPDLNWRNPAVKQAMFDVLRFWLERGVDGFRIDVAHRILKDPELRDNPPNPQPGGMHKPLGPYDSQLHIYDRAHPDVHAVFRELRQLLEEYSVDQPRVAIGEIHIFDWPEWATYYGSQLDELHLPFNFGLLGVDWNAQAVRRVIEEIEAAVPAGAWPNYVLGNHDESRIASRVGLKHARIAMLLLLTLRGTPTLYYGDEIGMCDVAIPPELAQDPWGKNVPGLGLGRDPQRTPMQWDATPHAGFCAADTTPWLPLAENYQQVNVAVQQTEPHSMLALTQRLLHLRKTYPALAVGVYRTLSELPDTILGYVRELEDQQVLVVLNFSADGQIVDLAAYGAGELLASTYMDRTGPVELQQLQLRGDEGCIVLLNPPAPDVA